MRGKDLSEMSRRLEEVLFISERGYEPVEVYGVLLWIKCHWGSVHSHAGALQEIARDESKAA